MNEQPREFRLKGGHTILDYIRRFSATEKAVFGLLVVLALGSAAIMAVRANAYFMTEVPADGGTLREGLVGLPRTVNPVLSVTDADKDISSLVYSGLVRMKAGAPEPDLARSWEISPDGLTYIFRLRPDARFQDGRPLTADDVVFTVQRIQDPALKSPRASAWANVTVQASTTDTVVFRLKQSSSAFLTAAAVGILPEHIWNSVSNDQFIFSSYNIEPIGSGPYRAARIERDQGGIPTAFRLSAWSGYYGDKPHIPEIIFYFFPDVERALSALETGAIDSMPGVPSGEAARLSSNAGEPYTIASAPLSRIFGVFFNQNVSAVLADPAIRKALDLSVDRSAIVENVLDGYGTVVRSPLPPGAAGPVPDTDTGTSTAVRTALLPPDMAAATTTLGKTGWRIDPATGLLGKKPAKKGAATTTLSFTLYTAGLPELKQTADILKDSWRKLGADVSVKTLEPSDLYQNVIRGRSYDALLFGEAIAKDSDLYSFWHSSERNSPGLNVSMYANSAADRLLESIRTETDVAARAADRAKLENDILSDVPAVFLYSPDFIYAVPKALRGLELGVIGSPSDRFASIGGWYLNTEKVWTVFAK